MPPCRKYPKFRFTFGCKDNRGYMRVCFHGKVYLVHCLVAESFLDNPLSLPTVDHINRIRVDNRMENLRFGSYKLQNDNTRKVDNSIAKYGVRHCDDKKAYQHAYNCAYYAEQKSIGRRERKCPDGKRRLLTDAEFNVRFGNESQQLPLF